MRSPADLLKKFHIPFLVVLGGLAFIRFYRLSDMGIFVNDAVVYITLAHQWLDGNFTIGANKLGYHLLCFLAAKGIGLYDDTILYLNSTMDILGIVLMYLLAIRLNLNRWLALSAVVVYGCLPAVLFENTRGLPHLPSMTFFLGSVGIFFLYLNDSRRKAPYIFFCGCFAAFAGMVHPTALAGVLLYPGLIFLENFRSRPRLQAASRALAETALYLAGAGIVVLSMIWILTLSSHDYLKSGQDMIQGLLKHHAAGTQGEGGDFILRTIALRGIAVELFGSAFLIFMGLAIPIGIVWGRRIRQNDVKKPEKNPAVVVWIIAAGYAMVNVGLDRAIQSRLLIPITPLVVLGTYAFLDSTGLGRRKPWFGPSVLAVSLLISGINLLAHPEFVTKPKTIIRQLGEQLEHRMDQDHRALLLPSQFDLSMLETMYLDARWLYRLREPWIPRLEELMLYRIRYIAISKDLNRGEGNKPGEADVMRAEVEKNLMLRWLTHIKANVIYRTPELYIFELRYPPLTGDSPVLTPRSLKFYNSLQADYIGPRWHRLTRIRGQETHPPVPVSSGTP